VSVGIGGPTSIGVGVGADSARLQAASKISKIARALILKMPDLLYRCLGFWLPLVMIVFILSCR
jgi:hypothetical protein